MSTSEIATVLAWHDALNSQDVDTLLQLSSDDIEVGGPKGASQGLAALREWATNAGITLVPGKMYVHHGVVVVEQTATWAAEPDKSATVASAFRVVADQVTSTFRHPDLETALAATDLSENDLVSES
ncbi:MULTISPECIES: nuclear transport factor 2 family protein [unclassified Rhodococcus (in: high G+C Gram-positive bacteria)]|uniref:nuclear transport factor 2 family protein n=1 Tax=unclassified Rhodococcus (in: high G+C Gram-positive bacteria) TaxID=192944 RepID=UPI002953F5F6|nr:nuclear transport factor 2 family protein [Rhodococcus sp. IEGM 1318]MDV8007305.1 nuclear transport factor 2 family protein [Rhodococcus sp. IEGM 1318]MDZ7913294.1 nuclear transport factor 2 family protein [Rhodococcus sp. (in: high G+C Gram-positive bacteria)]